MFSTGQAYLHLHSFPAKYVKVEDHACKLTQLALPQMTEEERKKCWWAILEMILLLKKVENMRS